MTKRSRLTRGITMILVIASLLSFLTINTKAAPVTETITIPVGQDSFSIPLWVNESTPYAAIEFYISISPANAISFDSFTDFPGNAIASPFGKNSEGLHYFGFRSYPPSNTFPTGNNLAGTINFSGYKGNQALVITVVEMNVTRVDANNKAVTTLYDSPYEFLVYREGAQPNYYTVTFDLDGGVSVGGGALVQSVPEGGAALAPVVARTGFVFDGWEGSFTNVTSNRTVTALWKTATYNITWNADGGSPAPTQKTVGHGGTITQPAPMTKAGFNFAGWFTNANLTGAAVAFPVNNVTGARTYWAKWTPEGGGPGTGGPGGPGGPGVTYTVTFDPDGGVRTGGGQLVQTVAAGAAAVAPVLRREGYTFDGWDSSFANVTEDITVTAQWLEGEDITIGGPPLGEGEFHEHYFDDVTDTLFAWAEPAVCALAEAGIVKGTADRIYSPRSNIKRGDFILMLVRAFELDEEFTENFPDVPEGSYYYDAIGSAKALGIAEGYGDGTFRPNAPITRQEMMSFIDRAMDTLGMPLPRGSEDDLLGFSDQNLVADYAREHVAALIKSGVIIGNNNRINPRGNTTRAEMAVALYRLILLAEDMAGDTPVVEETPDEETPEEETPEEETPEEETPEEGLPPTA